MNRIGRLTYQVGELRNTTQAGKWYRSHYYIVEAAHEPATIMTPPVYAHFIIVNNMNYKEDYTRAFNFAKNIHGNMSETIDDMLETMFPSLKETDEEKARKKTISIVEQYARICKKDGKPCEDTNECIKYLESIANNGWTEDDVKQIDYIINDARQEVPPDEEGIKYLESLRNRVFTRVHGWVPNERQISLLESVRDHVAQVSGYWGEEMTAIITELKALL